ncbi:Protein CBG05499 [Caenorhabditis briggsae]|uniref:Protein CBG05499 n=2 Tax=Caenorhabditis briggsae TaxID=6238 RepID=A8X009_CAEBR|nr:Protein CBG05499 [Caenorhabditis briggsae]CAP25969.1 Protein CBG05499 [Caenorhabditis briggsae]
MKMNVFVYSSIPKGQNTTYFLWICDNHQTSIFTSKAHTLALGHFFEGIFKETPNEKSKWQCVKYMKPAEPLLKGEMVANHVVLRTSVEKYKPEDASKNWYPQVHSKHLGKIIDNKKKLSEDCNGREIKTQLCKVGDDYRWVVIELL